MSNVERMKQALAEHQTKMENLPDPVPLPDLLDRLADIVGLARLVRQETALVQQHFEDVEDGIYRRGMVLFEVKTNPDRKKGGKTVGVTYIPDEVT